MIELAVLGCRPGLFVLDPTLFFIFCLIQQQLTMCTTSDQVSQLGLGDIPILPPRCLSGNGNILRFLIFVPLLVISAFFSIGNTPCVKLRVLVGKWFFLTKSPESSKMLLICNLKSLCWPLIKLGLKFGNYQQICAALGAGNDAYKLAKSSNNIFAVPMAKLSHLVTTSLGIVRTAWSQKTLLTQFILQKKTSSPYHRQASFGVSYASDPLG